MSNPLQQPFIKKLEEAYNNGDGCDVQVYIDDKKFKVKHILPLFITFDFRP
jgi:hypothetical protein